MEAIGERVVIVMARRDNLLSRRASLVASKRRQERVRLFCPVESECEHWIAEIEELTSHSFGKVSGPCNKDF